MTVVSNCPPCTFRLDCISRRTTAVTFIFRLMLLVLALLTAPSAWSQANQGTLEGTVMDQSGAGIPDAKLTATNEATAIKFNASSDASGLFTFPVLPVGTYTIEVDHPGFAKLTRKNITLNVGARLNLSLTLAVAGQAAIVTVTGETPILETTRSQVSSVINDNSVENLPTNGRNFINFALLTPGVTLDVRGGDISFAGQRGTLNSLIVDGSDNNNTFFGQSVGRTGSGRAPYQFSEDAVQEFQVNSNAYSAELGHAGGAVINVVTKSGTNDFHGTAFEFYRDKGLNANDPINIIKKLPRSPYHFNQFGGDIGGPVVRNKLFFFFDYDGQRNTLPNLVFLGVAPPAVPTANQQAALAYLQARDNPWTRTQNQNVYLAKADWQLAHNELLSVRYNAQRFVGKGFENGGPQNSLEHTGASDVTTDTLTGSLTSTISGIINVFRAGYTRDNEPGQANSINPEATIREGGVTDLVVGRNFFSPRFTNIHRGEFADTASFIHGRHTIKAGMNILVDKIANFFPGNFSGAYVFNSLEGFGCNLNGGGAACFTGVDATDTFTQAFGGVGTTGPTTNPNLHEYSFFGQDEWRVRNDLTFNFGLRYDLGLIAQPQTLNPSASLEAAGIFTNRIHNDHANFGPRIGLAWTPLGSKLVVRTGYGIFYGRTPAITVGTAFSNNALNVQTLTFSGAGIPQYPNTRCGAPVTFPSCAAPAGGAAGVPTIFVFQQDYHQPDVQQANLGLEYQIQPTMSIQVNYLWVKGTHLTRTRDINLQGPETPTVIGRVGSTETFTVDRITQPRPIAGFGRIAEFESNANSFYNGLTLQVNKRFSENYQFLASYTYGKVIDDNPDATAVVPFSSDDAKLVQDPLNIRGDRGPGINDQRHRFVLSTIWDLDGYTHSFSRGWRYLIGGWQLSGILTAQTGQPYSALVNFDLNKDGNSRTDRVPGIGRDTFRLPKFVSLDPRITKSFSITERVKAQLILEAYNSLNTTNFTSVSTTQFSASTSTTTCAGTPNPNLCLLQPRTAFQTPLSTQLNFSPGARIVQLSAKISF